MPRVFIADPLDQGGIEVLNRAGLDVDNRPGLKGEELKAAIRAADAMITRSATKVTAAELDDPGKLRAIARAGVGVDTIDVSAATRKGIVVMNTPGGNSVSAAEHTIALMLAMARRIPEADSTVKKGGWDRNKFIGTEVTGKTFGIIGLGRIGREVAKRALGLGMKVVGFDPFVTPEKAAEMGIEPAASIEAMLPEVDFLTIHVPLTNETRSLIGAAELAKMRKTSRILNVARGGVIDEQALTDALSSGTIAGAAVDVFSKEPIAVDNPLLRAPNIVLTPHLGASTIEAQENVALEAAHLIADFLNKGVVANAVNMAAVDRKELEELREYAELARRLGLLQAQLSRGTIVRVRLTYKGELASRKTRMLTAAFTAGLLEYRLAPGVNLVNAELIARERGIEIIASSSPQKEDFAALLLTEVESDGVVRTAGGTLFGNQYLRLVRLDRFRLEAYLDGVMAIVRHTDKPGLIGFLGTRFGEQGVNIAAMTVGRRTPGGEAIGVLNLDAAPPPRAVEDSMKHEHVAEVRVVVLPGESERADWLK